MSFEQSEAEQLLADTGRMCCLCGTLHRVSLHHIQGKEEGGTDDIDNAIPLCPNCHDEVHGRCGYSPGRTTRTYTPSELRLHRQRTIDLASKAKEYSPGTPAWEQDKELVLFYGQCLDRAAFRTHFHEETSFSAFDRAMEDTLLALNTGYWRTREGAVIDRAKGKSYVVNREWREKLDRIAKIIEEIRQRFHRTVGFDEMLYTLRSGPQQYESRMRMEESFRHDRSLGKWMDGQRSEAIGLLNSVLEEIGHPPLATIDNW